MRNYKMKKQAIAFGNEDDGMELGTMPALYVLTKQPQITGKADQEDLLSDQEDCGLASSIAAPVKSKVKTCLPADCTSGNITVTLDNNNMWNEFYYRSTEMILTKQGRRMFPYCRYWITGLDSKLKYILVVDISPVDNLRYRWNGHSWEPSGKAEPHVLGRVFIHPESPSTGRYWMHQPVSFYKLKLTNNTLDQEGHIILHSMHRYLPRLHLVPADKATDVIQLNGPDVHTFIFPQTEFFAVPSYQNIQMTQLKVDYNPFAKGFKTAVLSSRLEHKAKQNDCPEQERRGVANFTSSYRCLTEGDVSDMNERDQDGSCNAWKMYKSSEKKTLTPDTECDASILKQGASECPTACENDSRVKLLLNSNDDICISIKDEAVDEYGPRVHPERILMTQEDTDTATEKYLCRDNKKISEKQLEKNCVELGRREVDIESHKQLQSVAKAKTLKLGSGTVPGASLRCCGTTKNMTTSVLRTVLSSYKTEKSSLNHSVNSLPVCFENNKLSSPLKVVEAKHKETNFRSNNTEECYLGKDVPWINTYSSHTVTNKAMSPNLLPPTSTKFTHGAKERTVVKKTVLKRDVDRKAGDVVLGPIRRGRPRKVKFSEVQASLKFTAKSAMTSNVGPDVAMPEYEDVDGVLFASFASKEVLDKHRIDNIGGREGLQNGETSFLTAYDSDTQINLQLLERKLLEDLKSFRHRQVIHPSLQEVGLKLGSVDPTLSIDLKYLGVLLPLGPSKDFVFGENQVTDLSCQDTALSFISKTGKTNDFRKIKGWQGRLNNASKQGGGILEDSLKNRSAFCSDKLDKYLEREAKLMESVGISSSLFSYPMDCRTPSKGTSCVEALNKVPERKPIITPSNSYTVKPLSLPSFYRRRRKAKNKRTAFRGRVKSPQKFIVPLPVLSKQEHDFSALENISRSRSYSQVTSVPELDGNVQRKQIALHQAQQRKQSNCPLHLSQMKLMELEDCALRDGRPRTCITEEWADLSLETLSTSQVPVELMKLEGHALQNGKPRTCISKERADLSLASLLSPQTSFESKPIFNIISSQEPGHNGICQLGSVCASLASGTCQPTLSGKTDCTFDCLKKRMALLKGVSVHQKSLKKYSYGIDECCYRKKDWELEHVNKQMRSNDESFFTADPVQAVMDFQLRVKEEGDVFIPDKRAVATKTVPDDSDAGGELLSGEPLLYPNIPSDVILADHSYVCRMPSKTDKVIVRSEKLQASEGMSDEAEDGVQTDVPVCDTVQKSPKCQEEALPMKCSNGEQMHIVQMQRPMTDSEGPEQKQLTLFGKLQQIISMSRTEKQQKRANLFQSPQQNQHELLRRRWKMRGDSMQVENDKEAERGALEISCTRNQNCTTGKKCVDSAQEFLPNGSAGVQGNCNISCCKKGLLGFRGENQAFKDDLAEPNRTQSKSSQNPVAECLGKNASKTNYWENGPVSFGIAKSEIGNSEKTDDSAEEDIDGSSDHQIETLVQNTSRKGECSSIKLEEKMPHLEKVEAQESEITIYNTKLKENKLPAHPSEFHFESIIHESSAATSEMAKKNAEIVGQLSSDAHIFHPDAVSLDHTYSILAMYEKEHHVNCPEKAPGDTSQSNGRDSSQSDEKMIKEPGEFSKKSIISHLKTTAAHALLPRQSHLDHDSSNKVMPPGLWKKEPKNGTASTTSYRPTHTAIEQRRRKQIKALFEKLQGTLGLHSSPKVAERILLEQATEDIQRLQDQAAQLTSRKKFLLCKRNNLIRKVSALSGKPQEAILKKLEYIFAKQKALEEQENQNQQEMVEIIKTARTAEENSPFSLSREMKPVILSSRHTKPLICSKNRSNVTENEDSFMMPRIVNVMSLTTEENTNLLLDWSKPYITPDTDSQKCLPSVQIVLQETTDFQSEGNAEPSSRKQRDATGTGQVFLKEKENCFPQTVNASNMKGSPELFATKLFIEELSENWVRLKEGQKSKDSSFQKLQDNEPKDSGVEMELQKVASAIPEPALGASDLMDIKNNGIDETLTSLLNEIISLNQQLTDAAPDRSKLPNSPSIEFSLEGTGDCVESAAGAVGFHFQLVESCKDLCFVQGSGGSVTPLLLHLEDEDLTNGGRDSREPSCESGVFNLMPVSEVKYPNYNISATTSGGSWRNVPCMAKTTNVSLPVLQMKSNLEPSHFETQWKPMPKLAPFGLKGASFLLDSGRPNTRIMPLLAPVGANLSSVDLKATHSAVKERSIK